MISLAASAIVAGLLWAAPGWAQETAPDPNEPAEAEASSTQDTPVAGPARADEDPFDYEASEQISEDLSVSFPVDI